MTAVSLAKVFAAATLLAVAPAIIYSQDLRCDRGDLEVRRLDFVGNKTFPDADLANVIVTTPSAYARRMLNLPWSAKRCLNRAEFTNDRLRLLLFYRRRGFPNVHVDTALTPDGRGGATVRFAITEGAPAILRSFVIAGLENVAARGRIVGALPIRSGDRFDRVKIDMAMDSMTRRLRNAGYPSATAENIYAMRPDSDGVWVDDSITVHPGPFTRIGATSVGVERAPERTQHVSARAVRRIVGIDSGGVFREKAMVDAQRALYETDAYAHVAVTLDAANGKVVAPDSVIVPLKVDLVENPMHAARVGVGYGTLDCFRATAELDDYSFLGAARRLELRGRVSKIGIGKPLNGASSACPQARNDPYSKHLNYYLGASLRQPVFLGLRTVPTFTAFTSRVSEYNAYVRTTPIGGIATVIWRLSERTPITFSYKIDYGRTEAQPALFCAVFNLCAPDDRARVQQNQRLGVASVAWSRDWTNNPVAPSTGGAARIELRYSSGLVLSDSGLKFQTFLSDVSRYLPLGSNVVIALRARTGFVGSSGFIPPHERMFAGGPTTVRGFRQNELGAVTYIARSYDTVLVSVSPENDSTFRFQANDSSYRRAVPVGGNSLLVGNAELRIKSPVLPELLQWGIFADVGDVWNRGSGSTFKNFRLKVTPGVQMAVLTPIGPARVVLGYNPYKRDPGPIYYENSAAAGGSLPCVSPGNTLAVTRDTVDLLNPTAPRPLKQASGECTGSFSPVRSTSFRSRLTFSLAIGQAF